MKDNLSVYGRRAMIQWGVCTVFVVGALYSADKIALVIALFVGYLLAATCFWVLVYRTWKSSRQGSIAKAKKQMQIGFVLRLVMFFVVIWTAIHISIEVFWTVFAGFALLSIILMSNVIVFAYNDNAGKK